MESYGLSLYNCLVENLCVFPRYKNNLFDILYEVATLLLLLFSGIAVISYVSYF